MNLSIEKQDAITIVTLNRPEVKNAIDRATAQALADAFRAFDSDDSSAIAILYGANGTFCSGADLKAVAQSADSHRLEEMGDGPLGVSRMLLSKPVIAAISGYAVAGGLELALWCDLRVVEKSAILGVFCRRWGVPLIDGGTVRLPRLIGQSRALDLILTGRPVGAEEALAMGLANRVVEDGQALEEALQLARELLKFPQTCLKHDRLSVYEQWSLPLKQALKNEFQHGLKTLTSQETQKGAKRFVEGAGRHGSFDNGK